MKGRVSATPMSAATQQLQGIVNDSRANDVKVVAVEELACMGKQNSKLITLELVNAGGPSTIILGTPAGISAEYTAVPYAAGIANIMFLNLATLADNQGLGLPFLQLLNKRFVRTPIFVSHIEVITPNTALGNSQKAESVKRFVVPYNSATDGQVISGAYVPQFTEYTAVTLLDAGIVLGEFSGFAYRLLENSSAKINIHIAAIDSNTFLY
jgi:hypothetical protein